MSFEVSCWNMQKNSGDGVVLYSFYPGDTHNLYIVRKNGTETVGSVWYRQNMQ